MEQSSSPALTQFEQALQTLIAERGYPITFEALTRSTAILRHADPSWFILFGVGTDALNAVRGGDVPAADDPIWLPLWQLLATVNVTRSEIPAFDLDLHPEDRG